MTLFWQHFRAQFRGTLVWLGVTVLLTIAVTRSAPAMMADDALLAMMERMPPALQAIAGMPAGLSLIDGYVAMKIGPTAALILALYAVVQALSVVTREVDKRTIDFLLAMPVDRRQVLFARAGVIAANTGLLAFGFWAAVRLDMGALGMEVSWGPFTAMVLMQALLALALGAVALMASIWIDDYSAGVRLCLGITVGLYFLEMMLRVAEFSRWARAFSPFSYGDGAEIFRQGTVPWVEVVLLAAVTAAALALAVRAFERKQISA